jgi:hypothetical protein
MRCSASWQVHSHKKNIMTSVMGPTSGSGRLWDAKHACTSTMAGILPVSMQFGLRPFKQHPHFPYKTLPTHVFVRPHLTTSKTLFLHLITNRVVTVAGLLRFF